MNRFIHLAFCFVLGFVTCSVAQESLTEHTMTRGKDGELGSAKIDSMKWLAGHWTGEATGGIAEEIWSPPHGGEMIGMFRLVQDGKPAFYEFMSIAEKEGGLRLRIKHFDANFKGWEAQDKFEEFAFLAEKDGAMYFNKLSFVPNGADGLKIFVADEADGKFTELAFEFQRAKPAMTPAESSAK